MEEGVQVRVQVECGREEVNNGEKAGEGQTRRDGPRTDDQTLIMDDMKMEWRAHTDTRAMQCDMQEMNCANCMRKMTCEVYLSTLPVGYSGSLSTVNETNSNERGRLGEFLWAHFQFHSDLSHHDVLEEGCHLLYCSGEMGSSTCSPDSRWRRFLAETAARKSDRSFIGPFLPDLFKVRYHCPWYLLNSFGERGDTYGLLL